MWQTSLTHLTYHTFIKASRSYHSNQIFHIDYVGRLVAGNGACDQCIWFVSRGIKSASTSSESKHRGFHEFPIEWLRWTKDACVSKSPKDLWVVDSMQCQTINSMSLSRHTVQELTMAKIGILAGFTNRNVTDVALMRIFRPLVKKKLESWPWRHSKDFRCKVFQLIIFTASHHRPLCQHQASFG